MLISLIVPCYNEEEAMPLFYKEASRVAAEMKTSHGADFEFIFVDDGSRDGTLRVARELHAQDDRVRYVSFSRNFGKEAGIYAGLQAARGDYVATMDADLQDPPALLPQPRRQHLVTAQAPETLQDNRQSQHAQQQQRHHRPTAGLDQFPHVSTLRHDSRLFIHR